ncbi:Uncharacterised protein [Vibrio cholerae]|nr:Uncharacterised protein [Vibrio cholerae]
MEVPGFHLFIAANHGQTVMLCKILRRFRYSFTR